MAENAYLKFDEPGITGSSSAPGHVGEIEVLSWRHGGPVIVEPAAPQLTFTKYVDSATNELLALQRLGGRGRRSDRECRAQLRFHSIRLQREVGPCRSRRRGRWHIGRPNLLQCVPAEAMAPLLHNHFN